MDNKNIKVVEFILPDNLSYIALKFSEISKKIEKLNNDNEYKDYLFKGFEFTDNNYNKVILTFIKNNIEFNLKKGEKAS